MKGKYASAAERRRVLETLERRAAEAERAREKAEAALATEQEAAAKETGRLKDKLRSVTAERDAAAGPEVTRMEALNDELRKQLNTEREYQKQDQMAWQDVIRGFRNYLTKVNGLTVTEAYEVLLNMLPGHPAQTDPAKATRVAASRRSGSQSPDEIMRLEVARGLRHPSDVLRKVLDAVHED